MADVEINERGKEEARGGRERENGGNLSGFARIIGDLSAFSDARDLTPLRCLCHIFNNMLLV